MSFWYVLEHFIDYGLPVLLGIVSLFLLWRGIPRGRIKSAPVCRACRYNLTGSSGDKCPECGFTTRPTRRQIWRLIPKTRIAVCLVLTIPLFWVLGMCVFVYSWAVPHHRAMDKLRTGSGIASVLLLPTDMAPGTQKANKSAGSNFNTALPRLTAGGKQKPRPLMACDLPEDNWRLRIIDFFLTLIGNNVSNSNYLGTSGLELLALENIILEPARATYGQGTQISVYVFHGLTRPYVHYTRRIPLCESGAKISQAHIFDAGKDERDLLASLAWLPDLKTVHVRASQLGPSGFRALTKLTNVSKLSIDTAHLTPAEFGAIENMTSLASLEVAFNRQLTAQDLQAMARLPKLECLVLNTRDTGLTTDCDKVLATLIEKGTLKDLCFDVPVDALNLSQTRSALEKRQLKWIIIDETPLGQSTRMRPRTPQ
jgi:hypothetical protein